MNGKEEEKSVGRKEVYSKKIEQPFFIFSGSDGIKKKKTRFFKIKINKE